MKPYLHAKISVKRWGGSPEEYYHIHDWIDQCKAHIPDVRHRMILHNSFGIYLCEQVFGHTMTLKSGKEVSIRDIAEQHIIDDLGRIPTLSEVYQDVPTPNTLAGGKVSKVKLSINQVEIID